MRYRKLCTFVFSVLLVLPAGCQSPDDSPRTATPQEQARWNVVYQMQVEREVSIAAFMDQESGFTVWCGNPATMHYTSDGGQSWTRSEHIQS
jgi:hypothetical protein